MQKEQILVIGALGQIGCELTAALRKRYGKENILATDIRSIAIVPMESLPYRQLDVLDKPVLEALFKEKRFSKVYHLAAMLSANGENNPQAAWQLNIDSLLNVLDLSVKYQVQQVFWPSSIAVFGPNSEKQLTPQSGVMEPGTIYGISKLSGEMWCKYYHEKFGLDVRSLRYPGLISYTAAPGGGTTDYAVDVFHKAVIAGPFTCFLKPDTALPMMYMPDAIRATLELMDAPVAALSVRTSYNLGALSFTPTQLFMEIRKEVPGLMIDFKPDFRQHIADSWPQSVDDSQARADWGWEPEYDLEKMVKDMLRNLSSQNIKDAIQVG